jgi:hypothetical protein
LDQNLPKSGGFPMQNSKNGLFAVGSFMVNTEWEKEWEAKTAETSRISDTGYWNKRADDYANFIRTSDFEHGRKIKAVLEKAEILKTEHEVLDHYQYKQVCWNSI